LRSNIVTDRFRRLELDHSETPQRGSAAPGKRLAHSFVDANELDAADVRDDRHWLKLADQNRRAGAFEESLRHYSRAVEVNRSCVTAWVGQVQMLVALGEYPEAELWARKALELFRNHSELQAARAQALCRQGDLRQAQAACDAAISQPGLSAYPWMARGDLMLATRDSVEQYCFDKASQLDGDWLVQIEIAAIYLFYRRHAKALARCRHAVERAAEQPYAWFQKAKCELAMGMPAVAKGSLKQSLDLDPKFPLARELMREVETTGWSIGRMFQRILRGQ
jgi:tetratricopeptide (TPR) repeat protein